MLSAQYRADLIAIHLVRHASIPEHSTTTPAAIPISHSESIGQDAKGPLGVDQAGEEGLRSDLQGLGYGWRRLYNWRDCTRGVWTVGLGPGWTDEDLVRLTAQLALPA
jgi:hypothetical protein